MDVEMGALPNPQPQGAAIPAEQPPPEIQALSPEQRREWGRARLAATLPTAAADEAEPRTKMDRVRRAVRGLFPT